MPVDKFGHRVEAGSVIVMWQSSDSMWQWWDGRMMDLAVV